jgi:predicted DNA-binding protein
MKQLKVALDDNLRVRLEEASAAAGRSLAQEIRSRIEFTTHFDPTTRRRIDYDKETKQLAADVMWLAFEVSRQVGVPWNRNHNAYQAVAIAIQTWLEMTRPPFERELSDQFRPDPPTLGRSIARQYELFKLSAHQGVSRMLLEMRDRLDAAGRNAGSPKAELESGREKKGTKS